MEVGRGIEILILLPELFLKVIITDRLEVLVDYKQLFLFLFVVNLNVAV